MAWLPPMAGSCSSSHLPVTQEPVGQPRAWATMAAVLGFTLLEKWQWLHTLVPPPPGRESTGGLVAFSFRRGLSCLPQKKRVNEVWRLFPDCPQTDPGPGWGQTHRWSLQHSTGDALGGDQPLQGCWWGSGLKAHTHTTFLDLIFQV